MVARGVLGVVAHGRVADADHAHGIAAQVHGEVDRELHSVAGEHTRRILFAALCDGTAARPTGLFSPLLFPPPAFAPPSLAQLFPAAGLRSPTTFTVFPHTFTGTCTGS
jgi:hypothetical protein